MTEKFKSGILSDASVVLLLNLFASALNYVYQILLAGVLSVEYFGTVNTIFSLMLVTAVPGSAITMLAARYMAICTEKEAYRASREFLIKVTISVTIFTVLVFLSGYFLRSMLGEFLKIDSRVVLTITVVVCALGYYHPLYSGCLSGLKKFFPLGIYALAIPVYKMLGLGTAVFFKGEYLRLLICLGAMIPGSVFTAFAGFAYVKKSLPKIDTGKDKFVQMPEKSQWVNSLILNAGLVLYMNIDILAVRHIGGTELSGIYSAVVLFGRIIYYGATSIGTVLLPMVATKKKSEAADFLRKTVLLVGLISIVGLLLLNVLKIPLIQLIYGPAYLEAANYVFYVSIISFATGLLTILINFFVGIDYVKVPRNVIILLSAVILFSVFLLEEVKQILLIIGISGILAVLGMLVCWKSTWSEK